MSPDEVLQKPEFIEQGITDLRQLYENKKKNITKIKLSKLKQIIKEEKVKLNEAYLDVSETPEVQAALVAAGFARDGTFGMDGYLGPRDWSLYSPRSMEEAEEWIDAAIALNVALKQAEVALDSGKFNKAEDAFYEIIHPVQRKYKVHGAADTEGRDIAAMWLEEQGYVW